MKEVQLAFRSGQGFAVIYKGGLAVAGHAIEQCSKADWFDIGCSVVVEQGLNLV